MLYELQMISSVTLDCQVTVIVMNSDSQLSQMLTISHKFTSHVMSLSWSLCLSLVFGRVMSPHCSDQMSQKRSQVSRIALWLT